MTQADFSILSKLSKHPSFHDWFMEHPKCGCGSDKALFDYVPDSFWFGTVKFRMACCPHDHRYEVGGTQEDKILADRELMNNLTIIADESITKWYVPTMWARHRAMTYYDMVMRAGRKSFNFKNGEEDHGNIRVDTKPSPRAGRSGSRARNKRRGNGKHRVQRSESECGV